MKCPYCKIAFRDDEDYDRHVPCPEDNADAIVTSGARRPFSQCRKIREVDEFVCFACGGLRWGVDEDTPDAAKCVDPLGK